MLLKPKKTRLPAEKGYWYISAIVLGFNDALVELTAALAGFTMALQNNQLIILAGVTTGVAATLSMAASEFLSQEADNNANNSYLSALYTGIAYLITVAILLIPFFIFDNPMLSLSFCLLFAGLIIVIFTYVTSRLRGASFKYSCLQMLSISFGVAAIAFMISWGAKTWWGITV